MSAIDYVVGVLRDAGFDVHYADNFVEYKSGIFYPFLTFTPASMVTVHWTEDDSEGFTIPLGSPDFVANLVRAWGLHEPSSGGVSLP